MHMALKNGGIEKYFEKTASGAKVSAAS